MNKKDKVIYVFICVLQMHCMYYKLSKTIKMKNEDLKLDAKLKTMILPLLLNGELKIDVLSNDVK